MTISRKVFFFANVLLWSLGSVVAAPDFSMVGYAVTSGGTTGGTGGISRAINSLKQLVDWAATRERNTTPEIVVITDRINANGDTTLVTIKNGANITILGQGTSGELIGVGLNIRDYVNVIVRNLKIREVRYPDDALTLDNVQRGWVDHCEFHSVIGPGITVDTYDGLLDIKKGSAAITVSWCYLHDHMKCSLIGHTDNADQQEVDSRIRVTYHHNYFLNTNGRNPSLRFGALHMFNNYFGTISDYGLSARNGAHAKVENCHYEDVVLPMSTDKFPVSGLSNGYICQSGNLFTGNCGANVISQTGCDFWNASTLPYSYALDAAATVKSTLQQYAGVGKNFSVAITAAENVRSVHQKTFMRVIRHCDIARASTNGAEVYDINGRSIVLHNNGKKPVTPGIYIVKKHRE